MKFCCLIVIILFTIRVSNGGRLTGDCLSTNGTCGTSGVTCVAAFGEGWIYKGKCCYGKPCCKYFPESKNYSCGFETVASCVFEDSLLDDFDWSRQSGKTPTSKWKTGPLAAAEGTYYIYTEASDRSNEDKAILTTEATSLQANFITCPYCLSFKYHMRGVDIGSLEVFAGDKTSSLTSIWKKIGPQTEDPVKWDTGNIDIPQYSNLVVTIVGSCGVGARGDIAIDDILLKAGACYA